MNYFAPHFLSSYYTIEQFKKQTLEVQRKILFFSITKKFFLIKGHIFNTIFINLINFYNHLIYYKRFIKSIKPFKGYKNEKLYNLLIISVLQWLSTISNFPINALFRVIYIQSSIFGSKKHTIYLCVYSSLIIIKNK